MYFYTGCACDEGYVLSGYECVAKDKCGCQADSGVYYQVIIRLNDYFSINPVFKFLICNVALYVLLSFHKGIGVNNKTQKECKY